MLLPRRLLQRCCLSPGNSALNGPFALAGYTSKQSLKLQRARRRYITTEGAVAPETEEGELVDPTADGTKFYSRMVDEIRKHQGLQPGKVTPSPQAYDLVRNYAENKDHYDLRELLIRLNFVLTHLAEITPQNGELNQQMLTSVKAKTASSARLFKKVSLSNLPRLPERFENSDMLKQYLIELTTWKYVPAMKSRKHLVAELVRDLLRPNSQDTEHCRSTGAYNIGIKYFIHIRDMKSARMLLEQMKTDKGTKPNTETYNILFSIIPRSLLGGKREYSRYYFNYFVRHQSLSHTPGYLGQLNKSNRPLSAKDSVYFHHPLEFLIAHLKEMAEQEIPANDETWNIVLCCARGLVAKSHVLTHMNNLRIPLTDVGLKSVVCDTADFMGPQKVIELINEEQFVATVNSVKAVIERLIDVPSSKNIGQAWSFLMTVSNGPNATISKGIQPTTSILNVFASRFARAGRLDWILGVMEAMRVQWKVYPNIDTWMYILEAAGRQAPHANKASLLRIAYVKLLECGKHMNQPASAASSSQIVELPRLARYWIRRTQTQFRFIAWLQNQNDSALSAKIADSELQPVIDDVELIGDKIQAIDPFNIDLKAYYNSAQALQDRQVWSKARQDFQWPSHVGEPLELSYGANSPKGRLARQLGICHVQMTPYMSVKKFEASPKDIHACFVPEWTRFYDNSKQEFRASIDEAEKKRRGKFFEDPYNTYLDDLRQEFKL